MIQHSISRRTATKGIIAGVTYSLAASQPTAFGDRIKKSKVITRTITAQAYFPGSHLPLLVHQGVFDNETCDATDFEKLFTFNSWGNSWRNGVYAFHHYHSKAHEALGVYRGEVSVQFGGPDGIILKAQRGDVIIIPAGVSHKRVSATMNYALVGAYPPGQSPDMMYGKKKELAEAKQHISRVPLPQTDPAYGKTGALVSAWTSGLGEKD